MFKNVEVNFIHIEENEKYRELIQKVARQAFKAEKLDKQHLYLNVILTNPEYIREVNKQYRKIDKETDVLSFPMFEKSEIETLRKMENSKPDVLGDIIISIPRVMGQANEYGHSFERELSYMVIHGFYHLMGYDHETEKEKKQMREKEENVLKQLQILR